MMTGIPEPTGLASLNPRTTIKYAVWAIKGRWKQRKKTFWGTAWEVWLLVGFLSLCLIFFLLPIYFLVRITFLGDYNV